MSGSSWTVLDWWHMFYLGVSVFFGVFKWKNLINVGLIFNFLELLLITLNLLFKVLNSLCYCFSDFKVMLDFFHRSAWFRLFECVLCQFVVSVFKFTYFVLLQSNLCHFAMIVSNLLIIVVISWLLRFLQIINRFRLSFLSFSSICILGFDLNLLTWVFLSSKLTELLQLIRS